MSQWKFGNFETEIDFTDVDFLDRIDGGKQLMQERTRILSGRSVRSFMPSSITFSDVMQEKLCLKERQVLCYV